MLIQTHYLQLIYLVLIVFSGALLWGRIRCRRWYSTGQESYAKPLQPQGGMHPAEIPHSPPGSGGPPAVDHPALQHPHLWSVRSLSMGMGVSVCIYIYICRRVFVQTDETLMLMSTIDCMVTVDKCMIPTNALPLIWICPHRQHQEGYPLTPLSHLWYWSLTSHWYPSESPPPANRKTSLTGSEKLDCGIGSRVLLYSLLLADDYCSGGEHSVVAENLLTIACMPKHSAWAGNLIYCKQ